MEFSTFPIDGPLAGSCIYRRREHAFDFQPANAVDASRLREMGSVWLAIDTLEIEVSLLDNRLLWASGYWPDITWKGRSLPTVRPVSRGVKVKDFGRGIESGLTYRIDTTQRWTTSIDVDSGWVLIGEEPLADDKTEYCEFSEGIVAVIRHGSLAGISLRPRFLQNDSIDSK